MGFGCRFRGLEFREFLNFESKTPQKSCRKKDSKDGCTNYYGYLEVHCTYNLLSKCNYNPTISRVTVVMELIFRL